MEELPLPLKARSKPPLSLAVQLLKRSRDVFFTSRTHLLPPSILLTTLAGTYYDGSASIVGTVARVLASLDADLNTYEQALTIVNPSNPGEDLSECWRKDSASFEAFVEWIHMLRDHWGALSAHDGLQTFNKTLGRLFGETLSASALKQHARSTEALRSRSSLSVAHGLGVLGSQTHTGSVTVPKNTFFGS